MALDHGRFAGDGAGIGFDDRPLARAGLRKLRAQGGEIFSSEPRMIDWAGYLTWRPAFAAAMDPRLHTPEWLDARILAGSAQFWRSDRAAAITEIRAYPTGAYDVHGLVAAGDVAEVRDRIAPQVETWARAIGALGIVVESRPGWARALRSAGFEPHQLAVRREL